MQSNAYITVTCDTCGSEEDVELTPLARSGSWDERGVAGYLKTYGWITDDNLDFCSEECQAEYAAAPRQEA